MKGTKMWKLYDRIIDEIPDDLDATVDFVHVGEVWTIVGAGEYVGMAVTTNEQNCDLFEFSGIANRQFLGMPLKDAACYCESWDFMEASIGTAALNAYINSYKHLEGGIQGGRQDGLQAGRFRGLTVKSGATNGFKDYKALTAGKKVSVVGHFSKLEEYLTDSEVYVLERRPLPGCYPDTACEFILPETDYAFITGSAFINKTLPRLLDISHNPIVLGPSTPMSRELFERGAIELNGFSPRLELKQNAIAVASGIKFKHLGAAVTLVNV